MSRHTGAGRALGAVSADLRGSAGAALCVVGHHGDRSRRGFVASAGRWGGKRICWALLLACFFFGRPVSGGTETLEDAGSGFDTAEFVQRLHGGARATSAKGNWVSPEALRQKLEGGAVSVDVRSPEAFQKIRLPGSINVPLAMLKTKGFLEGKELILVGDALRTAYLLRQARVLEHNGFRTVGILDGGIDFWALNGGKAESGAFDSRRFCGVSPAQAG